MLVCILYNKTVLIVNPISSARYLASQFAQLQIRTIALCLHPDKKDVLSYHRTDKHLFDRQIHLQHESVDDAITLIDEPVDFVINGTEQQLHLTEQIAQLLTPKTANDPSTYTLRNNKIQQQEALKQASMPAIAQVVINKHNPDLDLLKRLSYPIFAKPLNGKASVGAFSADSAQTLLQKLKSAPDIFNSETINTYLIQEYITADEVVVDLFSAEGKHYTSHVYTYTKSDYLGVPVYHSLDSLAQDTTAYQAIEFAKQVLDACRLRNGFSHVELFNLGNGNFKLTELNPRVSGLIGFPNRMATAIGLPAQDQLLHQYLCGDEVTDYNNIQQKAYSRSVCLYDHTLKCFDQYKSYMQHIDLNTTPLKIDQPIVLTDIRTVVLMMNNDKALLNKEVEHLLSADKNCLSYNEKETKTRRGVSC